MLAAVARRVSGSAARTDAGSSPRDSCCRAPASWRFSLRRSVMVLRRSRTSWSCEAEMEVTDEGQVHADGA